MVFGSFFSPFSYACEACKAPSYLEAFKSADYVVLASRLSAGPAQCGSSEKITDNNTKIKILKTLKGSLSEKSVSVRSCYGMCDYGLFLKDEREYVIFLRKTQNGIETLVCKPEELLVTQQKVKIENKLISVDALAKFLEKNL